MDTGSLPRAHCPETEPYGLSAFIACLSAKADVAELPDQTTIVSYPQAEKDTGRNGCDESRG